MRLLLALRSVCFVFLLPGTVAGYVPFRILRAQNLLRRPSLTVSVAAAGALTLVGAAVLLRCVWDFFVAGGTLAPVDPPKQLVVRGLYRLTRNPMYNGVLLLLLGEAWLFRSIPLVEYASAFFVGAHLFVVLYEEPTLASRFGESYAAYRKRVPRWGFTRHPYSEER
jgi:protein-S-isoprenylcysteine O-methyltransferase Ste14